MKVKSSDISIYFGAAAIALLIFPKCNSSSKPRDTEKKKEVTQYNPYFPSSEGNYWEYMNEAKGKEAEVYSVSVTEVTAKGKDRIVKMQAFPYFNKEEKEGILVFKNDGSVSYETVDPAAGEPAASKMLPGEPEYSQGYSWNFNGVLKGYVSAVGQTVVTEAGAYDNCILITYTDGFTFSYELWFAKDKGIVKWGANRTNPPVMVPVYYVLKKISLN